MTDRRKVPDFFAHWRADWSPATPFTPIDYLDQAESVRVVLLAQWLFCPEMVEYRGGVYLADRFEEVNIDRWLANPDVTVPAVEEVVNRVKLWDLFANVDLSELTPDLEDLARSVATCWKGVLMTGFPDRRFVVVAEDEVSGVYGPGVTFFSTTSEDR